MKNGRLSLRIGRFWPSARWLGLLGTVILTASGCGEDQFRVGGTINGLVGSLTLQLDGRESLTQDASGPFFFKSQVKNHSSFTVGVTQAPDEQECSPLITSGRVSGADVDSIGIDCKTRTYTLGGTVEGLSATLQLRLNEGEILSISTNGRFTFQTKLPKGSNYTVAVAAQPQGNRCSVASESGLVDGNVESLVVRCTPWFNLTSFQAAKWIIGQETPTGNQPNRGGVTGQDTLAAPWGNPTLAGGRLYVSEISSNRILGFNGLPRQSIAPAEFVLGQPDFTSSSERQGPTGLASSAGISSDGARLAVADKSNSRILIYLALPGSTEAPADIVLGQPDFNSQVAQCGGTSLNFPEDVFIGHGKLIIADTSNNRVLVWNTIPTSNGASADLVLGQATFTTCAGNDKDGDGVLDGDRAPTASTLWLPGGVWTDGQRLVVSDSNNNRVLIWNQFPTTHGQPADVVLGQEGFNGRVGGTGPALLNSPSFVNSTGSQLFVADTSNSRVLVWNEFPSSNNTLANVVLGQQDFLSNNESDPPTGTTPSARSLYRPGGILLTGPYVVVTDTGNNRLAVFESP